MFAARCLPSQPSTTNTNYILNFIPTLNGKY
jgi:hypothetical protein